MLPQTSIKNKENSHLWCQAIGLKWRHRRVDFRGQGGDDVSLYDWQKPLEESACRKSRAVWEFLKQSWAAKASVWRPLLSMQHWKQRLRAPQYPLCFLCGLWGIELSGSRCVAAHMWSRPRPTGAHDYVQILWSRYKCKGLYFVTRLLPLNSSTNLQERARWLLPAPAGLHLFCLWCGFEKV